MRTRRTKEQIRKDNYNKDVDAYNFYVVNLDTKRAETGFEFKEDAVDVFNDYDDKKKYKVVSKRALKSMGIENPNESFKYEGGGDFQSGVYATGGGVQGKINQSKNIFQKQDLIRERYELLNDMYNNEDSNVDYTDIIKVGDVLYGDDINGYARIYREVNDPEKGDYFILQDRYNNKFAFLIIQTIRDLYAKELYIQNVNIPQKDFLYSDEVIDLNNQLEFHKGRINLYKKNPNDASNYSGINYSDYISSQSKVKELEDKLSLALKDEGHKFANGGSLIGNQKRIDLNKNGKIDAEDFKLLRTTMNGGWRKDHKYVNSSNPKEDYEVIYARKYKPSRKGYKGKTNFATGGGVDRFSEYSNDALYDMIINLSRYENTESDIQMVKAELEKRKGENKGVIEEMDLFDDKRLRLRKPVMPERKYSEREWAEKFNPRAYEFMGKRKMANGGSLNLDFRNFTLNDLIKNLPQDVDFMWISKINSEDYVRRYNKEFNKYANKKYTISDFGKIELSKGSENLYLDMKVFEASDEAPETEYIISIYTKDNQKGLKEFTNNLVQKFATGGGVEKLSFEDWLKKNNIEVYKRTYYWVADDGGNDYMYSGSKSDVMKSLREDYKKSFATGGGISKFKMLSDKVAKNYEGKRVKPQYQKEFGKVYSKSEAKEVGDKVAGKVKANQKMATGGETKKGARGGIMTLAKKIRKDGEKWTDAVKRAGQQLK